MTLTMVMTVMKTVKHAMVMTNEMMTRQDRGDRDDD